MGFRRTRGNGNEPTLGGKRAVRLSGMEPALSREFMPLYGRFRVKGLEAPSVVGRRRPLVVLAECDYGIAELAYLIGDSNGYDVRLVEDGDQALGAVRALQPNLLVVSMRLPVVDGLEVIQQVRSDRDQLICHIPILVMDVQHDRRLVLSAFEAGADDYLEMPYELPVMLRSWRRVTGSSLRPSPLTALLNEDRTIRRVAISYLLEVQPEGLAFGLGELLWQPDPLVRALVRWALLRLGTDEAHAVLEERTRPAGSGMDAYG